MRSPASTLSSIILVVAFSASAFAQQAPPPPVVAGDTDTVALNPFRVSATSDVGYVAANTLAGSRLNTPLKDTAASISVMTAEFMSDLGALDVRSALAYAPNIQNELSEEGVAGNRLVEFYTTYRIRGIKADAARNYFVWSLPSDTYNIERVDESRGPNSILFGIGAPGGIVNSSTKQPQGRAFQKIGGVIGDYDFYRGTLDLNQPLLDNKAGVRINIVRDNHKTFRRYEFSDTKAAHLSSKWEITPKTTIRAEGEVGDVYDNTARPWTVVDFNSLWMANGSPTFATQTPNAAIGVTRFATANSRVTLIENSNQLLDMKGALTTANTTDLTNLAVPSKSVADYSVNPAGPGATRRVRYNTYTVSADQQITENSFLQAAFNRQAYSFKQYDANAPAYQLTGDPNQLLPTGVANPYVQRSYLETNWLSRERKETYNNYRLTYTLHEDFAAFGDYRFAAMGERQDSTFRRNEKAEVWAGAPFGTTPEAAGNRVYRRTYFNPGDWGTYRVSGGENQLLTNVTDPITGKTLTSTWAQQASNIFNQRAELDTALAALQAHYWKDRIVAVVGYRRDEQTVTDHPIVRSTATNELTNDTSVSNYTRYKYNNYSYGAVFHATSWLSLNYNHSDNHSTPNVAHLLLPDSQRSNGSQGKGFDTGITLTLPDQKAFFKATYYQNSSQRETDFFTIGALSTTRNDRVLDALIASGALTAAQAAPHRTTATAAYYDRSAKGYEFELVANPTRDLRLSTNFSISDVVQSNIGREVVAWAASQQAYWLSFNSPAITSAALTIPQEVANLNNEVDTLTSRGDRETIPPRS